MTLPPNIATAVAEVAAGLRARFGSRIQQLVLFGSYARGEARSESDVDICVVIDELTSAEDHDITMLAADAQLRHDVVAVSVLSMSTARMAFLRSRELLIADEIARDGIPL